MYYWTKEINEYLASKSNLSADIWAEKIENGDFWFTGVQAIEFGVADGILK